NVLRARGLLQPLRLLRPGDHRACRAAAARGRSDRGETAGAGGVGLVLPGSYPVSRADVDDRLGSDGQAIWKGQGAAGVCGWEGSRPHAALIKWALALLIRPSSGRPIAAALPFTITAHFYELDLSLVGIDGADH